MILRMLLAVATVLALSSCAGGMPAPTRDGGPRTVDFECDGGEVLSVRFLPAESAAVLVRGGDEIRLQQQPAASGFLYLHGPTAIRGKGGEITVEVGRRVPLHCTAVR